MSRLYWIVFSVSAAALVTAVAIEYQFAAEPCSLCVLQRLVFLFLIIISLIALINNSRGMVNYIYAGLIAVLAGSGVFLAGRQLWLQNLPIDLVPVCTAGLERLLKFYPWQEALHKVIFASGNCAEVDFDILGLTMAHFSCGLFIFILACGGWIILKQKKGGY